MMKRIDDFRSQQGWFLDKDNRVGPLTMSYRCGVSVNSARHYHSSTYEYYLVLSGQAVLEIGPDDVTLHCGALVIVEPGEMHRLRDATDDFEVILMMDRFVPNDKVMLIKE